MFFFTFTENVHLLMKEPNEKLNSETEIKSKYHETGNMCSNTIIEFIKFHTHKIVVKPFRFGISHSNMSEWVNIGYMHCADYHSSSDLACFNGQQQWSYFFFLGRNKRFNDFCHLLTWGLNSKKCSGRNGHGKPHLQVPSLNK